MADTKKMRVAMVGVGGFGGYRRARMRESGLFELVAAYDWNADNLAKASAEDGCKTVGSYDELLDTPNIEAVIISTGGKFHAEQMIKIKNRLNKILSERTGQPLEVIARDVERDFFMTAEEAKAYGLIDEVLKTKG